MYLIKKTKRYFILLLCTVLLVGCSTKSPAVRGAMVGGGTTAIAWISLGGVPKNSQETAYLAMAVLVYSLFGALIGYIVDETGDDSEKNIDLNHYEDPAHNTYQH